MESTTAEGAYWRAYGLESRALSDFDSNNPEKNRERGRRDRGQQREQQQHHSDACDAGCGFNF